MSTEEDKRNCEDCEYKEVCPVNTGKALPLESFIAVVLSNSKPKAS